MIGSRLATVFSGVVLVLISVAIGAPDATVETIAPDEPSLAGVWREDGGDTMTIRQQDGFVDLLGRDKASIYRAVGLIEGGKIRGYGDGMQHEINQRFLYSTNLELRQDGTLRETWTATFRGGKKIEGETIFRRGGVK